MNFFDEYIKISDEVSHSPSEYAEVLARAGIILSMTRKSGIDICTNFDLMLVGESSIKKSRSVNKVLKRITPYPFSGNFNSKEQLIETLAEGPGLFYNDELATLFKTSGPRGFAAIISTLITGHDGSDLHANAVHDKKHNALRNVLNPVIYNIHCSTPVLLNHLLDANMIEGGYCQRLFVVESSTIDRRRHTFLTEEQQRKLNELGEILRFIHDNEWKIDFDDDALEETNNWRLGKIDVGGYDKLFDTYINRHEDYLQIFAIAEAVNEWLIEHPCPNEYVASDKRAFIQKQYTDIKVKKIMVYDEKTGEGEEREEIVTTRVDYYEIPLTITVKHVKKTIPLVECGLKASAHVFSYAGESENDATARRLFERLSPGEYPYGEKVARRLKFSARKQHETIFNLRERRMICAYKKSRTVYVCNKGLFDGKCPECNALCRGMKEHQFPEEWAKELNADTSDTDEIDVKKLTSEQKTNFANEIKKAQAIGLLSDSQAQNHTSRTSNVPKV